VNREVKAWLSNLALAALVAAVTLLLVLPAQAQSITWKVDGPASCTVTCTPGTSAPVPPPQPPAPVEPAPSPADPCAGITDARFNQALADRLNPGGFFWRLGRGLTAQEFACVRDRGLPGFGDATPAKPPVASGPQTGFVLALKGVALRNKLSAGVRYRFTVPTAKGERVQIQVAENASTVHGDLKSEVRGPAGELLSGPSVHGSVFFSHALTSPGGTLSFYIASSVDTSLSFIRN
jgi:hypothetical protein